MLLAATPLMPYSFSLDPAPVCVKQEPSSSEGVVPTFPQNLAQAVHAALKLPGEKLIKQENGALMQAQSTTPSSSSSHDMAMMPESSSYAPAKPSTSGSTLSGSTGSVAVVPQASATSGLAAGAPQHVARSFAKPQQPPAALPGRHGQVAVRDGLVGKYSWEGLWTRGW